MSPAMSGKEAPAAQTKAADGARRSYLFRPQLIFRRVPFILSRNPQAREAFRPGSLAKETGIAQTIRWLVHAW